MSANAPRFGLPQLPPEGLRRFLQPRPQEPRPGERCEMCAEPISDEGSFNHAHVVNLEHRSVMCTCRGCYLLFEHKGASQGKYRAVPDRYRYDPAFQIAQAQWDTIQIPVRMAFFFFNSTLGRTVAFYPSPAGATESLLSLETWDEVIDANPAFSDLVADVEALLVYRPQRAGSAEGDQFQCFLVPIDACYELVGRVKLRWKGFDGGQEAWEEIDAFFERLRQRSELVGEGAARGGADGRESDQDRA